MARGKQTDARTDDARRDRPEERRPRHEHDEAQPPAQHPDSDDAPSGKDGRLIGIERFPRKGDDEL